MSHDSQHPDDERVARLLADVRHTDPLPADVAARLDRALVGLSADRRQAAAPVAPVVDLAVRRRRRLTTGLVAAAAVVAIGVGLPTLLQGDSTDQASTSADESGGEAAEREFSSEEAPSESDAAPDGESGGGAQAPNTAGLGLLDISPDRFKRDARAAREQASYDTLSRPEVCGDLPVGVERVVPVRYADREGYLAYGPPLIDQQEVSLYLCPEGELARQVTIPIR